MRSVEGAPVAAVAGSQSSGYEEDEIHEPPDSQASQSEELPDGSARVAQTEAVYTEAAQEEGVQERCDEVVARVSVETSCMYTRTTVYTVQDQVLLLFL